MYILDYPVLSACPLPDADEIVRIFTLLEERNYSAITYVNTINQEIKELETRKKAIMDRTQTHIDHGGKAEKITQDLLKDVTDQIDSITKQVELREERILAQTQGLAKGKAYLEDCVRRIESLTSFEPPRQATAGDIVEPSLVAMLQYIERFVASKVYRGHQSSGFMNSDRSQKGANFGCQTTYLLPETREDQLAASNSAQLHTAEPRGSSAHHANIPPKDLPTARQESESDDYDMCERPLTDLELRARTAQSFLKRRKRDQRSSERPSRLGESTRASTSEARENNTYRIATGHGATDPKGRPPDTRSFSRV